MPTRSGFQLGPWLLTSKIASGGMGEVFVGLRAGRGSAQLPVAIKVLRAHLSGDEEAVERFLAEAQIAARFDHPHLVRTLEVGQHQGRRWLAMDLFRGVSLSTLLDAAKAKAQPLSSDVLVWVGRALCDGLEYAHTLKDADGKPLELVHRDVTPHNLLVSDLGGVRLTDFGVARMRESGKAGAMMGKLQYLSPEQLEGQPADRRSDVYSAGVTLFALATFQEPFTRESPTLVARAIRGEEPARLDALRPDLPATFVAAVKKAMARKPADRFATAGAFRDALGPLAPTAQEELGARVSTLCAAEVTALREAMADAESLAPQTKDLVPPPPSAPGAMAPRPRGTLEVETVSRRTRPAWRRPWLWGLAALGAALLGLLATR